MENKKSRKIIMDSVQVERALKRIAHQIVEHNGGVKNLVLVGILAGGHPLAERLAKYIYQNENVKVPVGSLDIALYRDDLNTRGKYVTVRPSEITFDINNKIVVLVDDVLFHGRTIRAAMDGLSDYGRPALIQLVALIDRGHRELPIHADYVGKKLPTSKEEKIIVNLFEINGADEVIIEK
jgi:pyrimidine operon attenuation protein/uracil phosphoribosyltransferase